jgi:hypothetical protein
MKNIEQEAEMSELRLKAQEKETTSKSQTKALEAFEDQERPGGRWMTAPQ